MIERKDEDLEADMYELAVNLMAYHGYAHYEISNWARSVGKDDYRCRHNLQYWQNRPYFGFGAGAHGYVNDIRTENVNTIPGYIKRMSSWPKEDLPPSTTPATVSWSKVELGTQMKDFMMLGLRLVNEGVSDDRFVSNFGLSMKDVFREEIDLMIQNGLLEWTDYEKNKLRLSKRGILLGNQVFMAFV
jgi:oxygen-independent coproporphyrinogen-3 oxidase